MVLKSVLGHILHSHASSTLGLNMISGNPKCQHLRDEGKRRYLETCFNDVWGPHCCEHGHKQIFESSSWQLGMFCRLITVVYILFHVDPLTSLQSGRVDPRLILISSFQIYFLINVSDISLVQGLLNLSSV